MATWNPERNQAILNQFEAVEKDYQDMAKLLVIFANKRITETSKLMLEALTPDRLNARYDEAETKLRMAKASNRMMENAIEALMGVHPEEEVTV